MNKTFGYYLKMAILKNNLTQKEAAARLHLSPQALSNYILDKRIPDMETMIHILQVFHMDANLIFQIKGKSMLLDEKESALITRFRTLEEDQKAFVIRILDMIPNNQVRGRD